MPVNGVAVLGSTGSIGKNALAVCEALQIPVRALTAHRNIDLLEEQVRRFRPQIVSVYDEEQAGKLRLAIRDTNTRVLCGQEGNCAAASETDAEMTLNAVVGMVGLLPTVAAIEAGKHIALANKETLVAGGSVIMPLVEKKGVRLFPVDSEHSAIFQSLLASNRPKEELIRILLTASGGPFFGKTRAELENVTREQALRHPNWSMGAKITIDSATMMNKGLEIMEASWLFDVPVSQIEVVVQRESIVHSMVEFSDHAVIAQLGAPDMKVPIQLALTYPERYPCDCPALDFSTLCRLHFAHPDHDTFRLMNACCRAMEIGGTMPAAVNAANEAAVSLFLQDKIRFLDIEGTVLDTLATHQPIQAPTLEQILASDRAVREQVMARFGA